MNKIFDFKRHIDLDELTYYCYWCNGEQFRKDIFSDELSESYTTEKFHRFQDNLPMFLANLSGNYKTRFCTAVHEFYINNKEKY